MLCANFSQHPVTPSLSDPRILKALMFMFFPHYSSNLAIACLLAAQRTSLPQSNRTAVISPDLEITLVYTTTFRLDIYYGRQQDVLKLTANYCNRLVQGLLACKLYASAAILSTMCYKPARQ